MGIKSKIGVALLWMLIITAANAQNTELEALASWVALDAPTGHEHWATEPLLDRFSGWQRDRYGNLVKTIGSGNPHRVVACGLDSYAYAVSQITEDGYLRLHRIGSGSGHSLWDQAHEGQQLRILTRSGPLIGVTAVANGHFASQHENETAIITQDNLWLDVGAETAEQVSRMGISLLDPVLRDVPAWSYFNEVAGPRAGARIGCAAVMAVAEAEINGSSGSTSYVISVQQVFGWIGLGAAQTFLGTPNEVILVAPGEAAARNEQVERVGARVDVRLSGRATNSIRVITPAVNDPDALMERITQSSAAELLTAVVEAVDPFAEVPSWVPAPPRATVVNGEDARWGTSQNVNRLMEIERTVDSLAEQYAVPGHEGPVRSIIYEQLPGWAKELAEVDDMGNLWVEFGTVSQATVFIAHMDEVGYEIESIEADGVVNLTRLGGVVTTAWEGQPAVLQLDPFTDIESQPDAPQLRGVFLTRSDPQQKRPESVQAWFGMNSAQLAAAGVRIGMGLTLYKEGHRVGPYRYASRSLDDRVGSSSLLLAIKQIDPDSINHRVIFAWSVREEGGLRGATALAERFGTRSRRVYSIDTFVSSDTPLESPHFAYAPLGDGPVLRSIENSGLAVPYELDRNRGIAEAAGIQAQIGLTQGSTDGTAFTVYGAPNSGLSWPGRYSHSPAEIADLRDIAGLVDLIEAMAVAPAGP